MAVIDLAQYKYTLELDSSQYSNGMKAAEEQAEGMKTKLSGVGSFLKTSLVAGMAAAGAAIVGTVVKGVQSADELTQAMNSFQAATGVAADSIDEYSEAMKNIYAANLGEDFEDIADAMTTITQTTKDLNPSNVEQLTKNALALRDTFDFDINESMRAVNMLIDQFGISGEEAFNLIAQGAQGGLDKNGDLLDSINEYSVHFKQLGLDAEDMFNSLANGADAGAFSVDKVGDALKEFGIRVKDGSTNDVFLQLGLDAENTAQAFAEGGEAASSAFSEVTRKLFEMQDPLSQNQAGVALFGTMWEDLGAEGVQALTNLTGSIDASKNSMERINSIKYNSFGEAMQGIGRQLETGLLLPLGEQVLPLLNTFGEWLSNNLPKIISTAQGILEGIANFFEPVITAVNNVMSAFSEVEGHTSSTFSAVQETISSVINIVQSVIEAFITLVTAIWDKWGADIAEFAQTHFGNIQIIIQGALDVIQDIAQLFIDLFTGNWDSLFVDVQNIASGAWELIQSIFQTAVDLVYDILNGGFTLLVTVVSNLMAAVETAISDVWASITAWLDNAINGEEGLIAWFTGLGESFFNIGSNLINWIWDGIKSVWESLVGWVQEKVDWIADKLSFWESSQEEMTSGTVPAVTTASAVNGSHANGLSYVPFDGYTALLHKGERVLTSKENAAYTSTVNNSSPVYQFRGGNITITGNADTDTINKLRDAICQELNGFIGSLERYAQTHKV